MSGGRINATELVASLINQKNSIVEGITYAQEIIDSSMTLLVMTGDGLYAARDGWAAPRWCSVKKADAHCASFEVAFAYLNLGYTDDRELGPGEIVLSRRSMWKLKSRRRKK